MFVLTWATLGDGPHIEKNKIPYLGKPRWGEIMIEKKHVFFKKNFANVVNAAGINVINKFSEILKHL